MKLISMTDFVLEQEVADISDETFIGRVIDYANFLKQPLTLGMFVPCDEKNEPLYNLDNSIFPPDLDEWNEYQQAKSKVLFEGWERFYEHSEIVYDKNSFYINFKKEDKFVFFTFLLGEDSRITHRIETIEDLAILGYELLLTQSAIDQLK